MNNINPISFSARPQIYKSIPRQVLQQCIEQKMTITQIAKELDVPYSSVIRDLRKNNLEVSCTNKRNKKIQDILDLKEKSNYSPNEIAKIMKLSQTTVEKIIATYTKIPLLNENPLLKRTLEKLDIPFDAVKQYLK